MSKTIELTDDECYLIEREFDMMYSRADNQFRQAMEQFILMKATNECSEVLLKKMAEIGLSLAEASTRYREISMKFEKLRLGEKQK